MLKWFGSVKKLGVVGLLVTVAGGFVLAHSARAENRLDELYPPRPLFPNEETVDRMERQKRKAMRTDVLTIDTRDQVACRNTLRDLAISLPVCDEVDLDRPYVSISRWRDISKKEFFDRLGQEYTRIEYQAPGIDMDEGTRDFLRQNVGIGVLGLATFGGLIAMPSSFSNWDTDNKSDFIREMPRKWKRNVKAGPVIDGDDWQLNYIGHPISGAATYQIARHNGLSRMASFGYSVFMSTFFWEYGVEAFAEIPSIQDLICTPVVGSLMGELFYQISKAIDENNGEVLHSTKLGTAIKILLNPAGYLVTGLGNTFKKIERVSGLDGYTSFVGYPMTDADRNAGINYYMGLQLNFTWK